MSKRSTTSVEQQTSAETPKPPRPTPDTRPAEALRLQKVRAVINVLRQTPEAKDAPIIHAWLGRATQSVENQLTSLRLSFESQGRFEEMRSPHLKAEEYAQRQGLGNSSLSKALNQMAPRLPGLIGTLGTAARQMPLLESEQGAFLRDLSARFPVLTSSLGRIPPEPTQGQVTVPVQALDF